MHALRSPLQFVPLVVAAATALALMTAAQEGIALAHEGESVPWAGLLKARLVDWYACALFMPVLLWLVGRYPADRQRWPRNLPILLLAAIPIAVAKEAIFVAVGNLFRPGLFDLATILAEDLSYEIIAVWALLGIAHVLVANRRAERPAAGAIRVRTRQRTEWVRPEEIELVDAQGNYARLSTPKGRYLVRETMAAMERRLGDAFVRVHRSAIVRKDRIARIEPAASGRYWIQLQSGERVRSGRSYAAAVRALEPRAGD
jgi:hypothetical protein